MKTKTLIIIVLAVAVIVPVGAYATVLSFFTNQDLYETISSYERIRYPDNSTLLEDMRHIPEIKEFLAKHVNTNRIIAVETDPVFTTLHASGGYTGEYLKMRYFFNELPEITYGCWTDNAKAPDLLFTSDIINHIKDDSYLDHFLGKKRDT